MKQKWSNEEWAAWNKKKADASTEAKPNAKPDAGNKKNAQESK